MDGHPSQQPPNTGGFLGQQPPPGNMGGFPGQQQMTMPQIQHVPATSVTNIVLTTQPQSPGLLVTSIEGHRHWTTGLFGCFDDISSCILTFFCLPCMECRNASRMGECCCMPYCVPGGSVALRARIRTMGGISGSVCNDCMTLSCCGACAVCQMSRELDNMGIL